MRGFPLLSVCRHPPPHPGKSGERLHRARSGESYSDVDSEHGGVSIRGWRAILGEGWGELYRRPEHTRATAGFGESRVAEFYIVKA